MCTARLAFVNVVSYLAVIEYAPHLLAVSSLMPIALIQFIHSLKQWTAGDGSEK